MGRKEEAVNDENRVKCERKSAGAEEAVRRRKRAPRERRRALEEIGGSGKDPKSVQKREGQAESIRRDINMLADYSEEIFDSYAAKEEEFRPLNNYMNFQENLRWGMRAVLVDWIIDVHFKLNLLEETLHLAVNLIDRFLSVRTVSVGKLQLVGVSGLLVASKFEEITAPSVDTFVILTDRSFTEEEILWAERYMLHSLEYKINFPSPLSFLRRCSKADNYNQDVRQLGKILLNLALLWEEFLVYPPSMVACAAMLVSRRAHAMEDSDLFEHFSRYRVCDLQECAEKLILSLSRPIVHESIFRKYGPDFTKKIDLAVRGGQELSGKCIMKGKDLGPAE
jgi:G2/mitotic-specific cyclin 2